MSYLCAEYYCQTCVPYGCAPLFFIYIYIYINVRNYDQTWRTLYHFGDHATRKKFRDATPLACADHRDLRLRCRLTKKTDVGMRNLPANPGQAKKRTRTVTEDFRLDPIANVPGLDCFCQLHEQSFFHPYICEPCALFDLCAICACFIQKLFTLKARKPFTFCASTWGDGTPGPVAFSVPYQGMPGQLMTDLNARFKGKALFLMSGTDSHMMNAETVLQLYQELYSDGFKSQRLRHGLTHQHRGLLLCDGFTGSHAESAGLAQRRQRWADACNVELPAPQPGGWSAKGQPCDQCFSHYKLRVKRKMDQKLNLHASYFQRSGYEELQVGSTGLSAN